MKYIFIIPTLIFVVSCKNAEPKIEPKELIGSWKMRDVIDQTGQNATEKTTFYKDSVVVEMFANKKLAQRFSTQYKFDTVKNVIHYEFEKQKLNLKILKLTKSEMEVQSPTEKKPIRLIRAE
ncbi:hypothetical protein [Flavobacterium capsici]|uniref:Lipocalin-like domain-containing protein n=1 Tax=Flavobacterium capsici TaxID=3075618 RepID=A0AA96EZP3_9FLAO|nr:MULTISPECIES: hypothetical protein [unclassified Flavobacterium]WNM18455.1 hypothetical protein RN608_10575 [Flavobacterium sp. PMR2A8]WNM22506.1 hypothetical protein RN605_03875 [Flavobacterium sp. PMTSA4]